MSRSVGQLQAREERHTAVGPHLRCSGRLCGVSPAREQRRPVVRYSALGFGSGRVKEPGYGALSRGGSVRGRQALPRRAFGRDRPAFRRWPAAAAALTIPTPSPRPACGRPLRATHGAPAVSSGPAAIRVRPKP